MLTMGRTRITHTPPEALFRRPLPVWKRAMDIVGALVALLLFSPIMISVALYIRITSPGRVFFRQERIGYLGRKFMMMKFRTMSEGGSQVVHKEHVLSLIREDSGTSPKSRGREMEKLDNDARIIRGGHFLRKAHFDELPQLFNVLRGEMSLVGPRPPIGYEVQAYDQWQTARLDAVPGMTGLWQVNGKNQTTFREMVRFDIRYARDRSIWLDTIILLQTCLMVANQALGRHDESGRKREQVAHEA